VAFPALLVHDRPVSSLLLGVFSVLRFPQRKLAKIYRLSSVGALHCGEWAANQRPKVECGCRVKIILPSQSPHARGAGSTTKLPAGQRKKECGHHEFEKRAVEGNAFQGEGNQVLPSRVQTPAVLLLVVNTGCHKAVRPLDIKADLALPSWAPRKVVINNVPRLRTIADQRLSTGSLSDESLHNLWNALGPRPGSHRKRQAAACGALSRRSVHAS
jgi:hypothetical protein